MNPAPFLAQQRFGLGSRATPAQGLAADPRGWLVAQLRAPVVPTPLAAFAERPWPAPAGADPAARKAQRQAAFALYREQSAARCLAQVRSETPLLERLTLFWSNHFCVSVRGRPALPGLVNRYEVEALRPHLAGRFEDMLLATARHPAMLIYLDNARSLGDRSPAGRRRDKGLNENYGRELLELHTLGVNGGYGQDDVVALAQVLTGWSLQRSGAAPGGFAFVPALHQPGPKTLLNHVIVEAGEAEGEHALRLLARHPATARHLCTKLATYFVADEPPPALIARLTEAWRGSDGDLGVVTRALIEADEAWAPALAKFRPPYEFVVASLRLTGAEPPAPQLLQWLKALDALPFQASSPAGEEDSAAAWSGSDAMTKRVDWAYRLAQHLPAPEHPLALADQALGPLLNDPTRQAIGGAESGKDAVGLLLASPAFQRR